MKVVILGKGEMLSNLIEGVLEAGCEIAGVFRYERTVFPSWLLRFHDFFKSSSDVTLIKKHKLYEIKCCSANSQDFKNEILRLNADVILVGTWREKLNKEIIALPVIASVNVHPSFLPEYRGPNPYLQTILNEEVNSGVTFHLMNEEFDKGAILLQERVKIYPDDTSKELKARTVYKARLMCTKLLKKLEHGLLVPVEQIGGSYYSNIKSEDMMLNFESENAEKIHARIRAFHPWLPCYVTYKNKFFIPNPYKLKILDEIQTANILKYSNNKKIGDVIRSNFKMSSITVLCNDNRAIRMDDVKLYGILKTFTKLYIKYIMS